MNNLYIWYSLPSATTMRAVPTGAIVNILESLLFFTAERVVMVLGRWQTLTRCRIIVRTAIFLAALPAPRTTTPRTHNEFAGCF